SLRVRGAPAIGIAAAYGVVIGMQTAAGKDMAAWYERLNEEVEYLASSRPTAVNLFWALNRVKNVAIEERDRLSATTVNPAAALAERILQEARVIHDEDREICRSIGRLGAELLADGQGVLTHCNAGGLATADYGTALAVFFAAHESGKRLHVYADE